MRCVCCCAWLVAVFVLAFEYVNAEDYSSYQQRYIRNRRPVVLISSGSGRRRIYTPAEEVETNENPAVLDLKQGAEKVRLDVYYETDCPDSMRFITRQLYPLYQEMEDAIDIHLVPYGKAWESYNEEKSKYTFRCQHGPSECYGNTVQSCVMSLYPDEKDYFNFINCMESYYKPSMNGNKCARRLGLDWDKIDKCAKGEEGNRLLHEMAQKTESIEPRLNFVPWIIVNNVYTEAQQRTALRNLKSVVCEAYKGNHPKC